MGKIIELIKKFCTKEIIFYGIFGILATIVNIGTFYLMTTFLKWNENISNIIAISLAVILAYFTNRKIVFHSEANKFSEKLVEFFKFILGRLFTMVIEYIGCALLFEYAPISTMISKCIITVIVIILNFFISKFFAFKKKD